MSQGIVVLRELTTGWRRWFYRGRRRAQTGRHRLTRRPSHTR